MIRRQTVVLAVAAMTATAFLALTGRQAQALTIENYSGAGNGQANGWVDLNYNDPNKKPSRDGDKRTLDNTGPRIFFGPSGTANQNFSPNQYFTPNYLMGK